MRAIRLAAIALLIAAAAAACSGAASTTAPVPTPSVAPSPEVTASPSEAATDEPTPSPIVTPSPSPSPTAKPSKSASPTLPIPQVFTTTVKSAAQDGRWKVTFAKPSLSDEWASVASAVNTQVTAAVTKYINDFTKGGLPPMVDGQPSTLDGQYTIAYLDPALLSVRLIVSEYVSGAAHPTPFVSTLNFDLATGKLLTLADEFSDVQAALAVFSSQSRPLLAAQLGPDIGDWINTGTAPKAENFAAWAFTTAGFEITFQHGTVGPEAVGTPAVVIPWTALSPVVKPGSECSMFTSFSG